MGIVYTIFPPDARGKLFFAHAFERESLLDRLPVLCYISISLVNAGCNIIAVLMTARNTEMIGAVVEALSAESWRSVMPTYCDITLGAKAARDEESSEMITMVLENRFIDFAYLYDGWSGWTFKLDGFLKKEGAFASTYESQAKSTQNYYDKLIAFFYEE